uniref:Uncharacterized protein n=1 Tax=Xiphophorus maculatus TaxID=8083 RepID=A0A3B5QSN2_XIPMA
MGALLLPVQRGLQDQLRELAPVAARLDVQVEVLVYAQQVGAQRVGSHVQVLRVDLGPGEARGVVVHVQNLDLHPVQLQRVFYHNLQVEGTGQTLLAQFFSVDSLVDKQDAVLQVDLHVLLLGAGHYAESARGQLVCRNKRP